MHLSRFKTLLIPCLILLAVTLPHLDQGDYRRDTGRYAAVGHYMWSAPTPFWQPYLNPETPYFNKPPMPLWIHGAFLKAFGTSLAVARIPSILAALGVVIFSMLTVRVIATRAEALASGIVLALTYEFFRRTREISLDLWQLFFVMVAVYLVIRGGKADRKSLVLWAGVPLGLALLCKPLVALGTVPILALWLWLLGRGRWTWLLVFGAVPVAILVALPWHYAMWTQFGSKFTDQYFGNQVLDRATGKLQTNPPFYFVSLIARTYWPWAILTAFAIWRRFGTGKANRRSLDRDLVMFAGAWVIIVLALISVFPDKKVNYALPVYPMLSWIAGTGLCRLPWQWLRNWYSQGLPWLATATVAGLLTVSVLPIQFQKPDENWQNVLAWAQTKGLDNLVYRDLPHEDICYFYLRTGRWMPRASTDVGNGRFILTRIQKNQASAFENQQPVLQAGNLAIFVQ